MLADGAQVCGKIRRVREPLAGVLREQASDQPTERHRQRRICLSRIRRFVGDDRRQRLHSGLTFERVGGRGQLVQHDAERELIRPEVRSLAPRLLGAHIRHRADDQPGSGLSGSRSSRLRCVRFRRSRETEVHDLDPSVRRHHDVVGFQIAVDDAGIVGGRESFGDLMGNLEQPLERHAPVIHFGAQRFSFDQLRYEVRGVAVRADVVDGDDVGMIERARGNGFFGEAALPIRVERRSFVEDLDCDEPVQARIPGPIDLAHASRPNRGDDLVRPEARRHIRHL